MNNQQFSHAVRAIQGNGRQSQSHGDGVICYATEGVWGLGCHPRSSLAFEKLLTIKQRPADKGVILLAGELAQLRSYIVLDDETRAIFAQHQHDFITFVLPKAATCPDYLSGGRDSLAVRVTAYPPLRELCLQVGTALVSTSANRSGQPPVNSLAEAKATFADSVDAYVDMPLGGQEKPSRIVAWQGNQWTVLRD